MKKVLSVLLLVSFLLPVSLMATVFTQQENNAISELELKVAVHTLTEKLETKNARVYIPHADADYALSVGLRMLTMRHLVLENDGLYSVNPDEQPMLQYYANSIAHYFDVKGAVG